MIAYLRTKDNSPFYYSVIKWKDSDGNWHRKEISTKIPIKVNNKRKAEKYCEELKRQYEEKYEYCKYKEKIRINASSYYGTMHRNRERCSTEEYKFRKKLRSIWSEGTFAVLKREHKLKRAEKRGIHRVYEECLLSALALNLKRMVSALSGLPNSLLGIIFPDEFIKWTLCQQSLLEIDSSILA